MAWLPRRLLLKTFGLPLLAALNYCIDQLDAGRILFSVDSPYEAYHDGCTWFDDHIPLGLGGKIKVGRSNAKAHLKFGDYVDHNVPVTK